MIASASQSGSWVKVYNEKGGLCFSKYGTLVGFTVSTVSITDGTGWVKTFDEKGRLKFSKYK